MKKLNLVLKIFPDPFGIFETSTTTTTPAPQNEINTEDPDDGDA